MQHHFSNLTSGFFGILAENMSAFSLYFACVNSEIKFLGEQRCLALPQRIPRAAFFTELAKLEGLNEHDFRMARINLVNTWPLENSAANSAFRGAAFLRLGLLDEAQRVADNHLPKNSSAFHTLSVDCIVQRYLEKNQPPTSLSQHLCSLFAHDQTARIQALAKIMVLHCRHKMSIQNLTMGLIKDLDNLSRRLSAELSAYNPVEMHEMFLASTAWRALAYNAASIFGKDHMYCISRALQYVPPHQSNLPASNAAIRDLKNTTLLSMSKIMIAHGQIEDAINSFKNIQDNDPYDPLASLENGMLAYHQGDLNLARCELERSVELGPPALGMKLFYLGRIELELGRPELAERRFTESLKSDPESVSSRLELARIWIETGRKDEAFICIEEILRDEELWALLDDDEQKEVLDILSRSKC